MKLTIVVFGHDKTKEKKGAGFYFIHLDIKRQREQNEKEERREIFISFIWISTKWKGMELNEVIHSHYVKTNPFSIGKI